MSRIIVGDVHGCFKTFLALKKKFPKNIPITFVGDLIDRGPLDQKMVQYVMDNQDFCDCVLGNHSHYCCDYYQKTKIYLPTYFAHWRRLLSTLFIFKLVIFNQIASFLCKRNLY